MQSIIVIQMNKYMDIQQKLFLSAGVNYFIRACIDLKLG